MLRVAAAAVKPPARAGHSATPGNCPAVEPSIEFVSTIRPRRRNIDIQVALLRIWSQEGNTPIRAEEVRRGMALHAELNGTRSC